MQSLVNVVHGTSASRVRIVKLIAVSVLIAAIWLSQSVGAWAQSAPTELKKTSIILSWFATGLNAPHYYAEDLGYYAEEGLEVEILESNGSGVAIKMVGAGNHPFGVADAAAMAQAVGAGVPVKMVAGLAQKSPIAILSLPGSGINTPADLKGKSVVMPPDSGQAMMFPVLLNLNGVNARDVRIVSADATVSINVVLQNRADGVGNYAPTAATIMEQALGKEPTVMYYADFGVQTLSSGLIASNNIIQRDPDLVERFVRATVRGWVAARENPRAAAEAYVKRFPELDVDAIEKMVIGYTQLMETDRRMGQPPGWMAEGDWQQTLEILTEANMLQGSRRPLDAYYTNDFISDIAP